MSSRKVVDDIKKYFKDGELPHQSDLSQFRYSLREDNGEKYVDVNTDQDIFEGKNKDEMRKAARKYIRESLQGKEIDKIVINKRSAEEYTYSKYSELLYRRNKDVFGAKMKASTELEAFIAAGKYLGHEDAIHPRSYNKGGYDRFDVRFIVDNVGFNGEMLIAINENGDGAFYDIVNIKESGIPGSRKNNTADTETASIDYYTQENEKVNTSEEKFSLSETEKRDQNAKKVYTKSESKDIIDEVLKQELQEKYGFEFKGGKGALITRLQESFNKTSEKNKLSTAMDIAEYIVDRTVLNEIDYDINTNGVSAKKLKTAVTDLLTTEDYAGIVGNIANKLVEGYDLKGKKDALTLQRDINAALKAEIKELSTKVRYAEAEKNVSMQIQNLTQSAKEFAKRKYSSQAFSGEEAQAVNAAFSKVVVRNKVNSDNAVAAIAVAKNFYTPERINGTTERETFGLYNQGVREDIEYLSETLESGKNLTFEQLKTLNNVMKAVTHVFRSIDTIIYDGKRRHTAEVASTAIMEQKLLPKPGKNRKSKAECLASDFRRGYKDYLFLSDFFFLNEKREREFAGSISPAFVRAIFVATGPTSSYISVAQRTTVEICVPSDGISARTICAIPIATPACGRRVRPRYF